MLAWLDLSDLLIKDLRYVQISSIAFQPFEEGENTTPISKDDLIQKLIPIVCSLMPDPSFLSVGKETHLVLKPFLSLSKTKNLNFSYFGELSLKVLSKKLKTNPVKDLVLDGNWPDQVQDILIPRLLSGSLSKLRFTSTISINYVEAAFTKWKDTEGVAEFELGGRQSHDFCHYVLECSRRCEIYQYLQDPLQNKDQKEMLFVKGDRKLKCSFFEDPANPRFSLLTL
ncbi:hypothetical protein L596_021502 [Steinernema carpocapsae]|uniref:F-box associated domain-containing protein n=1 Tax=Steinernema carpocapsae TaxID=34508 RepID=A0A4U5MIY3_STECR|nr:hypothetical protein L596_021502 [Steinernema carpocapsae]